MTYRLYSPDYASSDAELQDFYGIGNDAGVYHSPTPVGTYVHSQAEAYRLRAWLIAQWRERGELIPRYMIERE